MLEILGSIFLWIILSVLVIYGVTIPFMYFTRKKEGIGSIIVAAYIAIGLSLLSFFGGLVYIGYLVGNM